MIEPRLIKIGDIWLTNDQTENGVRYLSDVTGLDRLADAYVGIVSISANGTPYKFKVPHSGAGTPIRIELRGLYATDREDLQEAINTAEEENKTIQVIFSDGPDDADVECLFGTPANPRPIEFSGDFSGDLSFEAAINLTVVSQN